MAVAFVFLGPVPFINMQTQLGLIQGAVGLIGLGYGMVATSSFGRAQASAIRLGYEDNISTYIMISGKNSCTGLL